MNLTYKMLNKSKKILTEISAGELLDKISILEIKLNNIKDKEKLVDINKEYKSLEDTRKSNIEMTENLQIIDLYLFYTQFSKYYELSSILLGVIFFILGVALCFKN